MTPKQTSATCDCCEGVEILTPLSVANRPGLDKLHYRVGTYAAFLETMKARLSGLTLEDSAQYPLTSDPNPLKYLTTRNDDDLSIALLHAWANVADVLTFYQERIANEGYLRTATERRSILELARLIGYKLRPGVAATVYLAFAMELDNNEDIPAGTGAKSTPGPGELPQTFETAESLPARYEWNGLTARLTRPSYITTQNADDLTQLYFEGIATNLKPNDPLLIVFKSAYYEPVFHRVASVKLEVAEERTLVRLQAEDAEKAALAAQIASIQATLARYQELEAFNVADNTQMAQRVTALLADLRRELDTAVSLDAVATSLTTALPTLNEEHAIAVEGAYARLEPWVGELTEEITAHTEALIHHLPATTGGQLARHLARIEGYEDGNGYADPRIASLVNLVKPLTRPPSQQPANAQRLPRNLRTFFNAASDTVPRLLTRLKPSIKGTLYDAWANTQLTAPSMLESAQALRAKAAPFGHNAPLRPVYDEDGAVIGYEEWPLEAPEDITVGFRLTPDGDLGYNDFNTPLDAMISVTRYGRTTNSTVVINNQTDPIVRIVSGITFTITLEIPDGEVTAITLAVFNQTIRLSFGTSLVFVEIENLETFSLATDQSATVKDKFTGDTIQADFSETQQLSLLITPEQLTISDTLRNVLPLDAEHDQILPGSWVVIIRPDPANLVPLTTLIRQVVETRTISKAAYGITGKITQLVLDDDWLYEGDVSLGVVRQTAVYAQSEPLTLAEEPITDDVQGSSIELDGLYDGLEPGRWVIVSGERTDVENASGVMGSELMMLAAVSHGAHQIDNGYGYQINLPEDSTHTTLTFPKALAYTYKRDSVTVYGNVVKATHGETHSEVLGGGDGSQTFQTFALSHSPLTFLSAPTAAGAESTLTVRVNEVRWPEAEDLFVLGPHDRSYITRTDNEAKTSVVFGDGHHGARLPTGAENIKAVYRSGIGKPGNVSADKISQLASRPLGVKGVINPLPATGGADKEDRDQARRNAPLAVMALDRLVSVQDYADFARTFAGIGKAQATRCADGRRELVHLTIAGADDIPIDTNSDLYRNLRQALHRYGDPYLPIQLALRELVVLVISANVRILPDYLWEAVEAEARATLLEAFSFNKRDLGQDVLLSEFISLIQRVPGVAYVDVDVLEGIPEAVTEDAVLLQEKLDTLSQASESLPNPRIVAETACSKPGPIRPAQLAILQPDLPETLILTELT